MYRPFDYGIIPSVLPSSHPLMEVKGTGSYLIFSFSIIPWCILCTYNEDKPGFTCKCVGRKSSKGLSGTLVTLCSFMTSRLNL